jgi:predicted ATPase/class 3 adenylate cyclase
MGGNMQVPSGTVTFLFTDIEGSTRLAREHSDRWESLRSRHHEILRAAIEQDHGFVFQVIGDAFCAAFHRPADALKAAVHAQQGLAEEPWGETVIRVRMGIHTGEAETDGAEYHGYLTMSMVQRLMSAGHGGQVLVSGATENLLRGQLPEDVHFLDMGRHYFKDVPLPVRVFQVTAPGLQKEFPPVRTIDHHPNNLPSQLTSFVGREKERMEIRRLLQNTHMLTLIGPGGTGKTRLSIQAAGEMLDQFPDGVWLVEFAPILDPQLVPRTTAIAIGLRDEPQRPVIDMLCDYLHDKKLLLLLDNCEHLVDACARQADRILRAAPEVLILASSREALGIGGEVTYRVPSLGLPDLAHLPSVETLDQYEAVRLFIDRATSADPSFAVTNENAPAVAQICHRLDGIPLAIELAAAKIRVLGVDQIARRLDDRFKLLTGGSRTALERHQTLRAAIDWSYNLLPPDEQILYRRLSIFVGGWTLEAAESVCSGGTITSDDILDLLDHLIHKSLVFREESRYRMLETIRQYANEKLVAAGESDSVRDKHLDTFLSLAETAEPHLIRPEQLEWLDMLEAEMENLRLALEWSLDQETAEPSLRLCGALVWLWELHSYFLEGADYIRRGIEKPWRSENQHEMASRTKALLAGAEIEWQLGNNEKFLSYSQESLALTSQFSDSKNLAIAKFYSGMALMGPEGDSNRVRAYLEESLSEIQALNEPFWEAYIFPYLGYLLFRQGNLESGQVATKYLDLARQSGERYITAFALLNNAYFILLEGQTKLARQYAEEAEIYLRQIRKMNIYPISQLFAEIYWFEGNIKSAQTLFKGVAENFRVTGEKGKVAKCIESLGLLSLEEGDFLQAKAYLEEALGLLQEINYGVFTSYCLVELSLVTFKLGDMQAFKQNVKESLWFRDSLSESDKIYILVMILGSLSLQKPKDCARILGVIDRYANNETVPYTPLSKRIRDQAEVKVPELLGEIAFQSAYNDGEGMSLDDALDLAIKAVEKP